MNRWVLIGAAALLLIVFAAVYMYTPGGHTPAFVDNVTLYVYTLRGEPTGGASIGVPFARSEGERHWLHAKVGNFTVTNLPARIESGVRNLAHLSLSENVDVADGETLEAALALTPEKLSAWNGTAPAHGDYLTTNATVEFYPLDDILGVDMPGWGPGIYRGGMTYAPAPETFLGIGTAHAQDILIDTYTDLDMPDTVQDPAECAPTAASNAITGLTRAHGDAGDLPETEEMIEELKGDMNFNDGVEGAHNFIRGKNEFVGRHHLPILTQVIESPTIEEIAEAIDNDCAIEADIALFESRNGRSVQVGNHMVNITGAYKDTEQSAIHGHDPATGDGVDLWRFQEGDPWPYINYDREKSSVIKQIYVQCWIDEDTTSGTLLRTEEGYDDVVTSGDDLTEEGSKDVEMLVIDGQYFPAYQFHVAGPDACEHDHYHKDGGVAYGLRDADSTEVVQKRDPNPGGCGFGVVGEVPIETVTISYEQGLELVRYLVD